MFGQEFAEKVRHLIVSMPGPRAPQMQHAHVRTMSHPLEVSLDSVFELFLTQDSEQLYNFAWVSFFIDHSSQSGRRADRFGPQ